MRTKHRVFVVVALFIGLTIMVGNSITKNTAEASNPPEREKPQAASFTPSVPQLASSGRPLAVQELKLNAKNTVVFRSDFNAFSCAKAQRELLQKSKELAKGEPLYLVLDTPGGSIHAGNQLIDTANSLGRPVHTITVFAASMGFNTAQQLGKRYILPSGTLMAHRARVAGVEGQIPGEFITAVHMLLKLVTKQEERNAKRLGISFDEYTKLVKDEYWVEGEDAVRQGAADELASIKCDESLDGTTNEVVQSLFGPVTIIWDNCPAVTNPIGYTFAGSTENDNNLRRALSDYRTFRRQAVK